MNFLRKHWFDIGLILVVPVGIFAWSAWRQNPLLQNILWVNMMALLVHHFEEHRFPGKMYRMVTNMLFHKGSTEEDPEKSNFELILNVLTGWLACFLAAIFGGRAIWLGIAAILISVGNFFAHAIYFNWKEKRIYNPGMITAIGLFLPVSIIFFMVLIQSGSASWVEWIAGLLIGIMLNMIGIVQLFEWLKRKALSLLIKKMVT